MNIIKKQFWYKKLSFDYIINDSSKLPENKASNPVWLIWFQSFTSKGVRELAIWLRFLKSQKTRERKKNIFNFKWNTVAAS